MTEILVSDLVFPEALRIHDGRLWFVDMYDGKLLSVGIDERAPTDPRCEQASDSYFGGVAFPGDGPPMVVDKPARQILRTGTGEGASLFADLTAFGTSMLNEMIMLPDGDLVVGEYGFDLGSEAPRPGNLFRIDRQGRADRFAEGFAFPNGMALSGDRRSLFVAETMGRRIARLMLSDDGRSIIGRSQHVAFGRGSPDGLSIDTEDRIWAAMIGPPSLVRVAPDGRIDRQIPLDVPVYDVAIDPDGSRLYVATSRARMSDLGTAPLPRTGTIRVITL